MRVSEWIVAAFFAWTTTLAATLPLQAGMRGRIVLANACVLLVYVLVWRLQGHSWVEYARDWIPQSIMILAYKQMGWFAPATHRPALEHEWIVWDRLLLDTLHLRAALESGGVLLPLLLELSYALVYTVPPVTMSLLYARGLRGKADTLLTIYLLGLLLCYGQFPFWPSEPPRTVFPGQDMPTVHTPVREFNLWLVGSQGIHTSVFPSAHVSGVFAAAMAVLHLMPQRRRLIVAYFVYAVLVALVTVYGRYHYAVDAVGGIIIGLLAMPLGLLLSRARDWAAAPKRTAQAGSMSAGAGLLSDVSFA
ncbi:MAG TPA: phosphatase PAP2 family protein, partial [Bryobacteraceae bacterium]|nr:phosphatase PAP2 family protein [Bryobacteraceae bacterium]